MPVFKCKFCFSRFFNKRIYLAHLHKCHTDLSSSSSDNRDGSASTTTSSPASSNVSTPDRVRTRSTTLSARSPHQSTSTCTSASTSSIYTQSPLVSSSQYPQPSTSCTKRPMVKVKHPMSCQALPPAPLTGITSHMHVIPVVDISSDDSDAPANAPVPDIITIHASDSSDSSNQ